MTSDSPVPLADQSSPSMVNGIALDEQGYLWVADGLGSQLLRLEPPGETIVARYGPETGVDGPDDLVVDRDFIYYTADWTLNSAVAKIERSTGQHSVVAETGLGINSIAFEPSGKILAGASYGGLAQLAMALNFTGLYEVDPTRSAARLLVEDSEGMNAFCIPPDGFVYGPHGLGTAVLRIDLATGTVTTLLDGLMLACAVRYNARDEHLYVLAGESATTPILLRMALDGSDTSQFARLTEQPDSVLTSADNFVIAPDGTFYVTRFLEPVITRISPDGKKAEDFKVGKRTRTLNPAGRDR